MRSFNCIALATVVVATPLLASGAPTSMHRRSGVTCTKKYEGDLYLSSQPGSKGSSVGLTTDNKSLSVMPDITTRFQFDECTTDGWNAPPREFGQIKPVSLADQVQCVTASIDSTANGAHQLVIDTCGNFNGGILDQQWFYANYATTDGQGDTVTLTLNSNPNDDDATYNLPASSVDHVGEYAYAIVAEKQGTSANEATLTFYNVNVVS